MGSFLFCSISYPSCTQNPPSRRNLCTSPPCHGPWAMPSEGDITLPWAPRTLKMRTHLELGGLCAGLPQAAAHSAQWSCSCACVSACVTLSRHARWGWGDEWLALCGQRLLSESSGKSSPQDGASDAVKTAAPLSLRENTMALHRLLRCWVPYLFHLPGGHLKGESPFSPSIARGVVRISSPGPQK